MRKITTLFLSCLCIAMSAGAQVFPVTTMKVSGSVAKRINLVILPDGFTAAQLPVFQLTADTIQTNFFTQSPMKEYANFYNVYSIKVPSVDSGTDHPGTATDVTEPIIPISNVNTYFDCTFDGNFTHRALTCMDMTAVFNVLATNMPSYDQAILLANSFEYGGTGGAVATVSRDASSIETARHELGHSFAGLADEYWAGPGFATEKPNMTAETDTAVIKWHNWLHKDGVGKYAYGTTTPASAWFRPHQLCKMQFLGYGFCHVCQEAFIDKIYHLLTPIDSLWPSNAAAINYTPATPITFNMKLIKPIPNTLKVKWQLNGIDLASTDTFVTITGAMLTEGDNELQAFVTDTTTLSRSFWPSAGYEFPVMWHVNRGATGIVNVTTGKGDEKFFYKLYPVPVKGDLTLAYDNQTTDQTARYTIVDISGKTLKSGEIKLQKGQQNVQISTSGIIPGNYILKLNGHSVYVRETITVE